MKVLLVEDEIDLGKLITEILQDAMFVVTYTPDGEEGLYLALNYSYDLIILDLMLPNRDGLSILDEIRDHRISTPVLILTAMGDIEHRVQGLNLGADDYLAKPYEPRELVLRLEHILKKQYTTQIRINDFVIDKQNREILLDNYPIDLTKIEFEIFVFLVENVNKNLSREQILHATSLDFNTKNRTIDMHISNIRCKIGDDSKHPLYIKSVWGIGYKFVSV